MDINQLWTARIASVVLGLVAANLFPQSGGSYSLPPINSQEEYRGREDQRMTSPNNFESQEAAGAGSPATNEPSATSNYADENLGIYDIPVDMFESTSRFCIDIGKGQINPLVVEQLGLKEDEINGLNKLIVSALGEYFAEARSHRVEILDTNGSCYMVSPLLSSQDRNTTTLAKLRDIFPDDAVKRTMIAQLLANNPGLGFGAFEERYSIERFNTDRNGGGMDKMTRSVRGKDGKTLFTCYVPIDDSPLSRAMQEIFSK